MSVQYDPEILQHFADSLYAEAEAILRRRAIGWGFIGFVLFAGPMLYGMRDEKNQQMAVLFPLLCGLVAGLFFGAVARAAAQSEVFRLKLQAQQALCQVSIERNTRIAAKESAYVAVST